MSVVRPDDRLFRWPLGMALEIALYLSFVAVSVLVALAAWLVL